MKTAPTPAQLAAAILAYDQTLAAHPHPTWRAKFEAMHAALAAAAEVPATIDHGGRHEHVQRHSAG